MSFFVVSPVFPAGAFESQSPQTRMNTDFFTFRCTLPQKHMFNVVLTPHIAFQTTESFEELQHKAVLYAIDGAMGKISAGAVNGGCVRP